jgi:hypothetical protein
MAKRRKKRVKKWIPKLKKGALGRMAKAAGFTSWRSFCAQPKEKLSPLARRRCALARTLTRISRSR